MNEISLFELVWVIELFHGFHGLWTMDFPRMRSHGWSPTDDGLLTDEVSRIKSHRWSPADEVPRMMDFSQMRFHGWNSMDEVPQMIDSSILCCKFFIDWEDSVKLWPIDPFNSRLSMFLAEIADVETNEMSSLWLVDGRTHRGSRCASQIFEQITRAEEGMERREEIWREEGLPMERTLCFAHSIHRQSSLRSLVLASWWNSLPSLAMKSDRWYS